MSDSTTNRLYELLPRIIRYGDVTHGDGALLALLSVLDTERQRIDDDIARLYDNLFIETCCDKVIAHLGALVAAADGATRAEVANTLMYRRRSGLLTTIEQMARDVTGYAVRAAEPIPARDGMAERPGVELTVHLTDSYPIGDAPARRIKEGCFTFHPLGVDMTLFKDPTRASAVTRSASFVPERLLREDRATVMQHVTIVADGRTIGVDEVDLVDLGRWRRPRSAKRVHLDPERGRISFASRNEPGSVRVVYAYGARFDIGGGPYPRALIAGPAITNRLPAAADDGESAQDLGAILDEWSARQPVSASVRIANHERHVVSDPVTVPRRIQLAEGATCAIVAESGSRPWLVGDVVVVGPERGVGRLILDGLLLEGTLTVGDNVELTVGHCTVRLPMRAERQPGSVIALQGSARGPSVDVISSIVGPLRVESSAGSVVVRDSIIDAPASAAIASNGDGEVPERVTIRIDRSTVLGVIRADHANISNSAVPDRDTGNLVVDADGQGPATEFGLPEFGSSAPHGVASLDEYSADAVRLGIWRTSPAFERLARLGRLTDHLPLDTEVSVRLV